MLKPREALSATGLVGKRPIIEADEHWFAVTFTRRMPETAAAEDVRVKTRVKIVAVLRDDPTSTRAQLADACEVTLKTIDWNLRRLKEEAIIRRVGPDKGGRWEVVVRDS